MARKRGLFDFVPKVVITLIDVKHAGRKAGFFCALTQEGRALGPALQIACRQNS